MTIRLYPVTGALGVEVAEDPEDPEFWREKHQLIMLCEVKGQHHSNNSIVMMLKMDLKMQVINKHHFRYDKNKHLH